VKLERESYFEYPYRIISEKFVRLLDTGQLIGDPFNYFNSKPSLHRTAGALVRPNVKVTCAPTQVYGEREPVCGASG
jgi:hypothetical protein